MQRNKRVNNIVLLQWSMPVETQNLASPEEVMAIYSCYNQCVAIAFVACETQDFASLLNMLRFLVLCFFGHHFVCRAFCVCILCASTE